MKKILLTFSLLLAVVITSNAQWLAQPITGTAATGTTFQYVDVVNASTVWSLGIKVNGTGAQIAGGAYAKTINGGTTWTSGLLTGVAPTYGGANITATHPDTAWIATFNPSGGGQVYKTVNGGTSWAAQTTATFALPDGFPNFVHFWNGGAGVTMGDPNPAAVATGRFEIYTTTNGGTNWIRVPNANIPVHITDEYGLTNSFGITGNTVYFGTNKGRVYKSTDRGLNWTVSQTPFAGLVYGISFKDANVGFAVSASTGVTTSIAKSIDGGMTWSLVGNTAGLSAKFDVTHIPGTAGTFITTGARINSGGGITSFAAAYSINNGDTWSLVDTSNTSYFDLSFINSTTGWVTSGAPIGGIYKWANSIPLKVTQVQNNIQASVTPNPFREGLWVNMKDNDVYTIVLSDLQGRKLLEKQFSNATEIDTEMFANGVYFYNISDKKGTKSAMGKLVK